MAKIETTFGAPDLVAFWKNLEAMDAGGVIAQHIATTASVQALRDLLDKTGGEDTDRTAAIAALMACDLDDARRAVEAYAKQEGIKLPIFSDDEDEE